MALSDEDRKQIVDTIAATLDKGCLCGLGHDTRREMSHFFGMVKDLGNGDLAFGVEVFRKVISRAARFKYIGEKVGGSVAVALAVSCSLGIIGLVWLAIRKGISEWIKGGMP